MFERIYIRRENVRPDNVVWGRIAEALLFYEKVVVECSPAWLANAAPQVGYEVLEELISEFGLQMVLSKTMLGVSTIRRVSTNPQDLRPPMHGFHYISKVGAEGKNSESNAEFIERIAKSENEKRLLRLCEIRETPFPETKDDPLKFAVSDFSRRNISSEDFKIIIESIAPAFRIPDDFFLHGKQASSDGHFFIASNLILSELRGALAISRETPIGFADLMSMYLQARVQMSSCALFGCDFDADDIVWQFFSSRIKEVVQKVTRNQEEIQLFQKEAFPGGREISDAINYGHRSMKDFLPVLEGAKRFKKFLQQIEGDRTLMSDYIAAISSSGWLETMRAKYARFAVFTGGGLIIDSLGGGGLAGLGLTAFETLLLDKIVHKWKPNQFVDDTVRPFLSY
jgi:hypothetical protein